MIANKPVRFCISLIHLSIALFCFAFCIGYTLIHQDNTLRNLFTSNDLLPLIILLLLGITAFVAFIVWQNKDFLFSKRVSYLVAFLFLVEYIIYVIPRESDKAEMLMFALFIFPSLLLIFLLASSKVGNNIVNNYPVKSNILDTDFLHSTTQKKRPNYFLKVNRIIAISFFVFSSLMALINFFPFFRNQIYFIIPPFIALLSILLWVLPKLGSYIFAILCIFTGVGVIPVLTLFLFFRGDSSTSSNISEIIFMTSTTACVSLFFIGIALLLLSKEAKEEWKR